MDMAAFEQALRAEGYDEVLTRVWEAGQVVPEHTHPFDVRALVLDGEITLTWNGQSRLYRSGDIFVLAAHTPHAEAYGPTGARFLAGRPVLQGQALSTWQVRNDSYHTHALDFDFLWRRMSSQRTQRQAQYYFETTRASLGTMAPRSTAASMSAQPRRTRTEGKNTSSVCVISHCKGSSVGMVSGCSFVMLCVPRGFLRFAATITESPRIEAVRHDHSARATDRWHRGETQRAPRMP